MSGEERAREAPHLLATLGHGEIVELDEATGRSRLEFTALPEFCHSGGVVQGGFVTGWIDTAMARAAFLKAPEDRRPLTLEVKVNFVRSVPPGVRVRAEGWVEHVGRSIAFLGGRLTDGDGELYATATSTAKFVARSRVETQNE